MLSKATANSSVTKIVITHVLQKDGKDVSGTSRSQTFYKSYASKQDTVSCSGSGSYQIKTTYKITSPSGTELNLTIPSLRLRIFSRWENAQFFWRWYRYHYSAPNADKNVYLYPDDSPLNNTITGLTLSAIREIEDFWKVIIWSPWLLWFVWVCFWY